MTNGRLVIFLQHNLLYLEKSNLLNILELIQFNIWDTNESKNEQIASVLLHAIHQNNTGLFF